MSGAAPRVELSLVVADAAVADLLRRSAVMGGFPLLVADVEGKVVAGWSASGSEPPAEKSIPTDPGTAAERGLSVRGVSVYDELCGFVAAVGSGGAARDAAHLGADIVAALATRQYETESLSKSLLDTFEEVNLF